MKTLQDCKDRVAQRRNFDNWEHAEKFGLWVWDLVRLSDNAAELYGRYMRFVGLYGMRGRYILFEIVDLYPSGGMGDSRGNFDTIEDCIDAFKKLESCYICYIYDRVSNEELDIDSLIKR